MITVKNLNKSFEGQQVLHDINCQFRPGQNNLIIGLSGSGKTVLLKCLIGLLQPDSGEILYEDRNILTLSANEMKRARQEIGVLFQGSALFDSMNVANNVAFPLRMFGDMADSEIDDRVQFCLNRVGLKDALAKMPSELSGGMQKRVAIARAIALNPKYLFCDEPNSGLDPQTSIRIDQLIDDITKEYNITTIVNTHDMNSVLGIGDHITYLYQGRIEWTGTKDDILQTPCQPLRDFLFSSPILKKFQQ
ncbi:MAG: ABC transporter ATP-binding protein [Bacteroidales bacterium]|jgi:phospholipid/cholesterol/gamma-HCH transport system ATP-binding protein|nr:ABC transporter ATP-binding protein [Bacteroidales bacterium]